jgi:hypothetical protein
MIDIVFTDNVMIDSEYGRQRFCSLSINRLVKGQ